MTIPFWCFVMLYVILDPFEVIWHYDDYFASRKVHISLNHFNVSICNFDNRYNEEKWNSFIVGTSRSRYWEISDWEKLLPKGSKGYHIDHSGGSLYSLTKKFEYLDAKGVPIKNVLIIMDTNMLENPLPSYSHTSYTPPQMLGYKNIISYHLTSFKAFCDFEFLCVFFKELIHPNMQPSSLELSSGEYFSYNPYNNQIKQDVIETEIRKGRYYTKELVSAMFVRNQYPDSISPILIGDKQMEQLSIISNIIRKNDADCRVVISPRYNKIRFNANDIKVLEEKFGKGKVYDYSGVNPITTDYHNYYEHSHYRPIVTKKIMDEIYNDKVKFSTFK